MFVRALESAISSALAWPSTTISLAVRRGAAAGRSCDSASTHTQSSAGAGSSRVTCTSTRRSSGYRHSFRSRLPRSSCSKYVRKNLPVKVRAAAVFDSAHVNVDHVEWENFLAAQAVALVADLVQNRQTDLGHFGRLIA